MTFKIGTTKLVLAAALALTLFGGVIWLLALRQPATAAAAIDAPAATQGLPAPYLNHPNVVDAPYNPPAPAIDGAIAPGEYAGADKVTFPGYGGYYHEIEVFVKQDATSLYIAFDSHDTAPYPTGMGGPGPAFQVFLDSDNSKDTAPQPGDFKLTVDKGGGINETQGNGTGWSGAATSNWTAAVYTATWGWQAEFRIALSKLGITSGPPPSVVGLGLAEVWTPSWPKDWYWPQGGDWLQPNTWGELVSSSNWGNFYWKPGPWEDYAPSGMPDFDQKKAAWSMGVISTHCGPVAMANSLWWFDSKFETLTGTMPYIISDTYRMVTSYNPGVWDDHDPLNVGGTGTPGLVDDLARYFSTNQGLIGTNVISVFHGTHQYLRDHGLWDDYQVTLVVSPTFQWVADEVMRSEDVILLLGFYEWQETIPGGQWVRVGGHYVNVAGVDPNGPAIAFSDPFVDNAEVTGAGRVLSGTLITHYPPHPGPDPTIHDDAGNVSHDVYPIVPTNSPGGIWGPEEYPWQEFKGWFTGFEPISVNPHPEIENGPYMGSDEIQVEVEYALAVSPYTWKSSGYWEPDETDPVQGNWTSWIDYAINGVPDFDQKQDNWGMTGPMGWQWTYCGPVAAANSLWWFDSKFEPSPVAPTTPGINDGYPLVQSYDPTGAWDDHDPSNVEFSGTSTEFVDDLAWYFDTDGQRTGTLHAGTIITDVYRGLEAYVQNKALRQGYVITMTKSPDFWWVAEEVEHSEDVILLLGFWQDQGGEWVRLGGHYVTVPGIDRQGGFVAFSDPYYDGAEYAWPLAYPAVTPTVMGRVADGWLIPHPPYHSHAPTVHNDAGNVSHDTYYVTPTDSPGGVWGPREYVEEGSWPSVEPFWGLNGNESYGWPFPTADPIQAEVDWAVAVSPVADVWANKAFDPTTAVPGETVTITIRFGNDGSLPAENVVLTETLPSGLISPAVVGTWTSNGDPVVHRTGTAFTWDLPDLAWMEWGVITLTAQVDPSLAWPATTTLTNTVAIATSSIEQYQIPELPNIATAILTVQTADVQITKSAQPTALQAGEWLTYTLVYTNAGSTTAMNTVVTDQLHGWLENSSFSVWKSYGGLVAVGDKYTFLVGHVPASGWGIITITAQISPTLSGGGTLPNTALISTDTPESDYTNNTASASNTVLYYDVDLQPATGGIAENPGTVVTYTLTIYNTGNLTDTYNIAGSVSGEAWVTNWPGSVGPMAGGSSAQIDVTVQISSTAQSGDTSTATIVATSQGDSSKSATSVLTTTAQTGTITRGVEVAPATAMGNGDPGDTVTYTLRITNTGTAADVIGLSYTGPSTWTVSFSGNPVSLAAGAGTDVEVTVAIPASAPDGSTGVVTVTATSQADPTKTDTAILTTTVSWEPLYLPLIMRNY